MTNVFLFIGGLTCVLLCQMITYTMQVPATHARQKRQSAQETDIDNRFWDGRKPNIFGQRGQTNPVQNGQGQIGLTNSNQENNPTFVNNNPSNQTQQVNQNQQQSSTVQTQTQTQAPASTADANCELTICKATPEYNPVCGTNNQTYLNIGKLDCASICGVDVNFERGGTC